MDLYNLNIGTDLDQAYSEPSQVDITSLDYKSAPVRNVEYSPDLPAPSKTSVQKIENDNSARTNDGSGEMIYNQSELLQNINDAKLKQQMDVLKQELDEHKKNQKLQYKESYERRSIYDRFVRKQREMIRFVSISLIIIFALSVHDILSSSLKTYISNMDISRNRELAMRLSYPFSIFLCSWMIKVFARD